MEYRRQGMFDDWEQRLGIVLGTEKDEDNEICLPMVSKATLKTYLDYLRKQLVFPLQALYENETGPLESELIEVTIKQFVEEIDEFYGLLCVCMEGRNSIIVPLADLTVNETDPNYVFIDDYLSWFWNYR
jgi:hypothetical protein